MGLDDFIQHVFNKIVKLPSNSRQYYFFLRLRRLILRTKTPLVRYSLDGVPILVPLEHNLPIFKKAYPNYSSNLGRIAKHIEEKYPSSSIIDIGANIGDSVAILRSQVASPILCIEGDDYFFSILERNCLTHNDVYTKKSFVNITDNPINGEVTSINGTATITINANNELTAKTLSSIINEYPSFKETKLIKIDTDGFDICIIRGALNFIQEQKPVLFFEYDPGFSTCKSIFSIFRELESLGYAYLIFYENQGDYLLSTEITNAELLLDLHYFYSGRNSSRYCDICALHRDDDDLFKTIRDGELKFFSEFRQYRKIET
jgi:FkbM family methyltransferase